MTRHLLFATIGSMALTAMASEPVKVSDAATVSDVKIPGCYLPTDNPRVKILTAPDGSRIRKVLTEAAASSRSLAGAPALRADSQSSADVLSESFEKWDGADMAWVPDGWTVESKGTPQTDPEASWHPSAGGSWYPAPTDGNYYFSVNYGANQDEWLISPEVEMPESALGLYFDMNVEPIWFFSQENVDWTTNEFIGQPEIIFTVKVNVREAGGEWITLTDYANRYKDYTLMELYQASADNSLQTQSVDLDAYAGKKIQVAFQFVGTESNSIFIDNIRIGLPPLDRPVYAMPAFNQYWGTDRDMNFTDFGCAFLPAFAPLTWYVTDPTAGLTYEWEYTSPEGSSATSEGSSLTLSYPATYNGGYVTDSHFIAPPVVTATSAAGTAASYRNPAQYMLTGGPAEYQTADGTVMRMGVLPVNIQNDGMTITVYTDDADSSESTPIFGYNKNTDQFWTDYTFMGGNEPGEYDKVVGIINKIEAPSSPMVITGVHLDARGRGISDNVVFTCRIFPLGEGNVVMPEKTFATATVSGKDILLIGQGGSTNYYTLPFDFDKPVVLDQSYNAYAVEVYGFNNPGGIEYFAPMQSALPMEPIVTNVSFVHKERLFNYTVMDSYSAIAKMSGAYGPCYNAFLINLEAYYPWLLTDVESVKVGEAKTMIDLNSYYAAEDLTITAPEWVTVTASGRFADTQLTITAEYAETDREGELTVSAPGVTKTFTLTQEGMSGLREIAGDSDLSVEALYDLNGRKVSSASMPAGIYLLRRPSGKVEKVVIK